MFYLRERFIYAESQLPIINCFLLNPTGADHFFSPCMLRFFLTLISTVGFIAATSLENKRCGKERYKQKGDFSVFHKLG